MKSLNDLINQRNVIVPQDIVFSRIPRKKSLVACRNFISPKKNSLNVTHIFYRFSFPAFSRKKRATSASIRSIIKRGPDTTVAFEKRKKHTYIPKRYTDLTGAQRRVIRILWGPALPEKSSHHGGHVD